MCMFHREKNPKAGQMQRQHISELETYTLDVREYGYLGDVSYVEKKLEQVAEKL